MPWRPRDCGHSVTFFLRRKRNYTYECTWQAADSRAISLVTAAMRSSISGTNTKYWYSSSRYSFWLDTSDRNSMRMLPVPPLDAGAAAREIKLCTQEMWNTTYQETATHSNAVWMEPLALQTHPVNPHSAEVFLKRSPTPALFSRRFCAWLCRAWAAGSGLPRDDCIGCIWRTTRVLCRER